MTEFFNQVFQAWSDRIRSPILGSVALAFVAINWKPLYYLLFAETSVLTRFTYFDMKTDWQTLYAGPVLLGIGFAIMSPWIAFAGAWVAQLPKKRLHALQDTAAVERRIVELELKEREEEANRRIIANRELEVIESAERAKEAEAIGGERLRNQLGEIHQASEVKLKASLLQSESANGRELDIFTQLSSQAKYVLAQVGASESGKIDAGTRAGTGYYLSFLIDGTKLADEGNGRDIEFFRTGVEELEQWKILTRSYGGFNITPKGQEIYSAIEASGDLDLLESQVVG